MFHLLFFKDITLHNSLGLYLIQNIKASCFSFIVNPPLMSNSTDVNIDDSFIIDQDSDLRWDKKKQLG